MKLTATQIECMYEAGEAIVEKQLLRIDQLYGPGGRFPQKYHNRQHTIDVVASTRAIAGLALERGKITEQDVPLLVIAAGGHDLFYDPKRKGHNEKRSAEITIDMMKPFTCFEPEHVRDVGKLVMATTVKSFFPRLIQSVDPADYRTGIIADADLFSFGMPFPEFKPRAFAYLDELVETNQQRLMQYLDGECVLLENHQWHTAEAAELFPHVVENVDAVRGLQTVYAIQ
jgi:predicted metal-dependent HD superfamily phosphohydrolase